MSRDLNCSLKEMVFTVVKFSIVACTIATAEQSGQVPLPLRNYFHVKLDLCEWVYEL